MSMISMIHLRIDYLDRKLCSYPLGTRFDAKGKLIVADSYGGILRVDVDTGTLLWYTSDILRRWKLNQSHFFRIRGDTRLPLRPY